MSQQQILEQACQWLAKINADEDYDALAFSTWLSQSPEHQAVFDEVSENWQLLAQLNNQTPVLPLSPKQKNKPALTYWVAAAACIMLCFALFMLIPNNQQSTTIESQLAQTKEVRLDDGSTVLLNAKSTINVLFNQRKRIVILEQGDAHFNVAKDLSRPFIVYYQNHQFKALGTQFSVSTRAGLVLFVSEHSVSVKNNQQEYIVKEQNALAFKEHWQPMNLNLALAHNAWQHGEVFFEKQPLNQVLEQLAPYINKPIKLVNLGMQNEVVTGNFKLSEAEQALDMIALGLDLKIKHQHNRIILY